MVRLLCGDDRRKGGKGEVNTREGNQVGLELVQIDVKGTIESKGSSDGRDDLSDKTVKVSEARVSNVEALLADIVNSFIIDLGASFR